MRAALSGSRRYPLVAMLAFIAIGAGACVEVRRTTSHTSEDVIDVEPRVVSSSRFKPSMSVDGARLVVRVSETCDLIEEETVEVTTSYDQELGEDDRSFLAAFGVVGAIPATVGVALLADAPNVYESNLNGRLHNETGQSGVIVAGAILSSLGLAMVAAPIIHGLRAVGTDDETSTSTRAGKTLKTNVACDGRNVPSRTVIAKTQTGTVTLGVVGPGGDLVVDLKRQLAPLFVPGQPPPVTVAIWVDNTFVDEVRVVEIGAAMAKEREEQDELTWQAAESGACAQQRTAAACGGVQRYVGLFPQGRHAQEAQTLLSRLAPDPAQVAADPGGVRVDRARQAAAQAADDAAQKILEKLQADAAKAAEKAEQDARKAALKACVDACKKACEKDADCALTCTKEVCQ